MLDVWCEQGLCEVGWGQQALRGLCEGRAWCLRGLVRLQVALWLLAQLGVSTACCAFICVFHIVGGCSSLPFLIAPLI